MINFLCAANTNVGTIIIYAVLILILVGMLIMPYFTQKKKNQEFVKMLDSIRVGDLVKTAGGIIGKVTKITDKGEIKTVILETGSKTEKSYMEFDMSMIYCVLKSTKPAQETETESDNTAKIETKTEETAEVENSNKEETVEETNTTTVENEIDPVTVATKKPAAKKTAKKPATKKTTKK